MPPAAPPPDLPGAQFNDACQFCHNIGRKELPLGGGGCGCVETRREGKQMTQRCATCKFFQPPVFPNGKPDMRRDAQGFCGFTMELPPIPQWAQLHGWRNVTRSYGTDCKTWSAKPRKSKSNMPEAHKAIR